MDPAAGHGFCFLPRPPCLAAQGCCPVTRAPPSPCTRVLLGVGAPSRALFPTLLLCVLSLSLAPVLQAIVCSQLLSNGKQTLGSGPSFPQVLSAPARFPHQAMGLSSCSPLPGALGGFSPLSSGSVASASTACCGDSWILTSRFSLAGFVLGFCVISPWPSSLHVFVACRHGLCVPGSASSELSNLKLHLQKARWGFNN